GLGNSPQRTQRAQRRRKRKAERGTFACTSSLLFSLLCALCVLCGESSGQATMEPRQAYEELLRRVREASLLESCGSVLGWGERTDMPRQGAAPRAEQMALLARLAPELRTDPAVGELLHQVESSPLARDPDGAAANVREIRRNYDRAVKLPKELV